MCSVCWTPLRLHKHILHLCMTFIGFNGCNTEMQPILFFLCVVFKIVTQGEKAELFNYPSVSYEP